MMEEVQVQSLQGGWELDTLGRVSVRALLYSNFLPIETSHSEGRLLQTQEINKTYKVEEANNSKFSECA